MYFVMLLKPPWFKFIHIFKNNTTRFIGIANTDMFCVVFLYQHIILIIQCSYVPCIILLLQIYIGSTN